MLGWSFKVADDFFILCATSNFDFLLIYQKWLVLFPKFDLNGFEEANLNWSVSTTSIVNGFVSDLRQVKIKEVLKDDSWEYGFFCNFF